MSKLPAEVIAKALDSHIAILGKTGSGKSNAAKYMAEDLMMREERVVAVDPTGTWWGMRLLPSGKPSKFKPIIFGGRHADIAILPEHGAAIAEAVATSSDSAIIDLREMTVGGRTKFFAAFAEALLRLNRGKLHLMLDEAHLFAPQGRVNDPQSGIMLNATNNLVSLGRGNGIRVTMISQRPAKLHKDALTQAETLIAMRLIAPQDRAAINDWVGEWGDVSRGKEITSSLPSMSVGEAWIWAPEQGYLERTSFPKVKTLDTGSQDGTTTHMLTLKIDIEAVTARLGEIAADVIANDPKRLRSRIAELETALGRAKAAPAIDSGALEEARRQGFEEGHTAGRDDGYREGEQAKGMELGQMMLNFSADFAMAANTKKPDVLYIDVTKMQPITTQPKVSVRGGTAAQAKVRSSPTKSPELTDRMVDSGITGPQMKVLNALKVWQTIGHAEVSKQMLAALAGYSPSSGSFKNTLGQLRSAVRIDYPSPGNVSLLIDWYAVPWEDAYATFKGSFSGPQWKVVDALRGKMEVSKPDLADMTGYSASSGSFKNTLGSLRTLGVIQYPETGMVELTDWAAGLLERGEG